MTRRPLKRVPILETCIDCGRRAIEGQALCPRCLGRRKNSASAARPFPVIPLGRGEERPAITNKEFGYPDLKPWDWTPTICHHGYGEWWRDCAGCTAAADFDDGHDRGLD